MDHGGPTTRHGNGLAGDGFQNGTFSGLTANLDGCDPLGPFDPRDRMPHHDADTQFLGTHHQR